MHWLLWLLRWLLATTDPLGLLLQLACSRSISDDAAPHWLGSYCNGSRAHHPMFALE